VRTRDRIPIAPPNCGSCSAAQDATMQCSDGDSDCFRVCTRCSSWTVPRSAEPLVSQWLQRGPHKPTDRGAMVRTREGV